MPRAALFVFFPSYDSLFFTYTTYLGVVSGGVPLIVDHGSDLRWIWLSVDMAVGRHSCRRTWLSIEMSCRLKWLSIDMAVGKMSVRGHVCR